MTKTTTLAGLLPDQVTADLSDAAVTLRADATLYPLAALYGAAYVFIDRCYVLLDRPEPGTYRVTLSAKTGQSDPEALRALVGEFGNELLACAWRHQITQDNRAVIEAVATQALAGAMGPPSLDELEQFDFAEETFEDPLGIAMSWEDKYKKKAEAGTGTGTAGEGAGGAAAREGAGSGSAAGEGAAVVAASASAKTGGSSEGGA